MLSTSPVIDSIGWDGPYLRVRTSAFDVAFLVGPDEDLGRVDNVDAEVFLPDGSRWSATICTVDAVRQLMAKWAETGEHSGGGYFWCHDGLVVRDAGIDNIVRVLVPIHQEGELTTILNRLDEQAE